MKKAIVTLSFDDGRKDTYDVFMNLLKPKGIPATINIPSGYIEVQYSNPFEIGYNGLISKEQLDEIEQEPLFEIACHGYMHKNDDDDIKKGMDKLREWYPHIIHYGFASPHSFMRDNEVKKKEEFYRSIGISYVRLGRKFWKRSYYRRGLSKIASVTGSKKVFIKCYKDSLNDKELFIIHAIPIIKTTRLDQIKAIIDTAILENKWCVLEIHGIDKVGSEEYQELFCWDLNKFIDLCNYLVELREKSLIEIKNGEDIVNK